MRGDTDSDAITVGVFVEGEWQRRGLVAGVELLGGVFRGVWGAPVSGLDHQVADIVVVGVDVDDEWDRLGGLAVIARYRDDPSVRSVAVATDLTNPMLAVRAKEAGADVLCGWNELCGVAELEQVLLTPPVDWRPERRLDFPALRSLGVSPGATPWAGLELIESEGLRDAFDPVYTHRLSRRRMITLRERLAATIGVRPAGSVTASANQPTTTPSWRQLRHVVDLARGACHVDR